MWAWFSVCALFSTLLACGSRSALEPSRRGDPPGGSSEAGSDQKPQQCFTRIAAGGTSACALRRDGALFCWGNNALGQLGVPRMTTIVEPPTRVETLESVLDVSVGGEFACARTAAGLHCFGQNNFGQLGTGERFFSKLPSPVDGLPAELSGFSAGGTHACAVDTGGNLYCWGNNGWGELGLGFVSGADTSYSVNRPALVDMAAVTLVAAGGVHTCATARGTMLYCWGGRARIPTYPSAGPPSPVFVTGDLPPLRKLAAGDEFACLVTNDGGTTCWGANGYATLGDGTLEARDRPGKLIAGVDKPAADVACGRNHACLALEDGDVFCWGMNRRGALGRDPSAGDNPDPIPRRVAGIEGHAIGVAAGGDFSCALTREGDVWCWGNQDFGQLGVVSPDPEDSPSPRRVPLECP